MAAKKIAKKEKSSSLKTRNAPRVTENTGMLDFFRFGESYTSLLLGIVVVIISAILLISFIKNRNFDQLTTSNPDISATQTLRPDASQDMEEYTVQAGDDLWKIAEKTYNDGYQWSIIAKANNILNPSEIHTGQKLVLPKLATENSDEEITAPVDQEVTTTPSAKISDTPTVMTPDSAMNHTESRTNAQITEKSYTVVHGDTLWDIAVRAYGNGYRWSEIASANALANPGVIHSGNVLSIPR